MKFSSSKEERDEIKNYMERFEGVSPEEMLRYMGEMREFVWKCMTPEGRKSLLESKGIDSADFEDKINREYYPRKTRENDK